MLILIYSLIALGSFWGLFPWTFFWLLSIVAYFVIFSLIKTNHIKKIILTYIGIEVIFDLLYIVLFCFNHWYIEYGVAITYGFFVWCIMLLVGGIVTTLKNKQQM